MRRVIPADRSISGDRFDHGVNGGRSVVYSDFNEWRVRMSHLYQQEIEAPNDEAQRLRQRRTVIDAIVASRSIRSGARGCI
ncbi:hypothetical protein LZC95_27035 [Pendulispora brunnea]|uniref:Uncharacterized protein n=1 Tax=Pendulispora brunnea TaxID=2905690 RepID=A0ABZ2JUF9_9BACT